MFYTIVYFCTQFFSPCKYCTYFNKNAIPQDLILKGEIPHKPSFVLYFMLSSTPQIKFVQWFTLLPNSSQYLKNIRKTIIIGESQADLFQIYLPGKVSSPTGTILGACSSLRIRFLVIWNGKRGDIILKKKKKTTMLLIWWAKTSTGYFCQQWG